ncbi:MAG: ribbon-helix-helix domain-containing protein [Euryarchaeota archaeon]|nr:ribbon-helix-helix domain-containing protein [Euryarchaeota archaeon]
MGRHRTTHLPDELIDEVDALVAQGLQGYRRRAEFVKDAVRNHIRLVKKESIQTRF